MYGTWGMPSILFTFEIIHFAFYHWMKDVARREGKSKKQENGEKKSHEV